MNRTADKGRESALAFSNVETPPETIVLLRSYESPAESAHFAQENARLPIPLGQAGKLKNTDAQAKARGDASQR